MEKPAIIIIDMLNDFVTGSLRSERGDKIIPPLKRLIEAARRNRIPIVYSNDAHYKTDFEVVNRWGDHAIKGTKGAEVIPELKPAEQDFIVEKQTYSGFYDTGLDSLLRSLYKGEGVKTVILGGLHTNMCVRHTSADAFFRGYKIIIAKDGVEAFTEEAQTSGLTYLKDVYNAEIKTADEIVQGFPKSPSFS